VTPKHSLFERVVGILYALAFRSRGLAAQPFALDEACSSSPCAANQTGAYAIKASRTQRR
jgi:hypothetical protein